MEERTASSTKDERRAIETLLALKCVDAGKLPAWAWMRAVAACLRKHSYEFEPIARRRGRRGARLEGAKELRERVRDHLDIERLPPGVGEKLEKWGAEWVEKVGTRVERAKREDRAEARKKTRWEGVKRRAEATLERWGFEERLVRAGGKTVWSAVEPLANQWQPASPSSVVPVVRLEARPEGMDYSTGQINVQVRVEAQIRPSWYGRVYKRGIAIVDDCFIVDVIGFGPARDGGECLIVACAVPGVGFQVSMQNRAVYRAGGAARFLTAEEEAALRVGPWFTYDKKKEG